MTEHGMIIFAVECEKELTELKSIKGMLLKQFDQALTYIKENAGKLEDMAILCAGVQ